MDYSSGTALYKYQWDFVHDPARVITLFDEEEDGALEGGNLLLANIYHYLNAISQANENEKQEINLSIATGSGEYGKVTLGNKEFSFLKMKTLGFNPFEYSTSEVPNSENSETSEANLPQYHIMLREISRTNYLKDGIAFTKYQFHELEESNSVSPFAQSSEATGIARIEIHIKSNEAFDFEEYLFPTREVFLDYISWVSQFDENIFGLCTGCWRTSCCRRAVEYMMGNTNIANCTDSLTAISPPYMTVEGIISTANFADNSSRYTRDSYNSAQLQYNRSDIERAVNHMKAKLNRGRPVIIGVHYTNGNSPPPNNSNRATRHFMVVVGVGRINDRLYFRFYDPGRGTANLTSATSSDNILYLDSVVGKIEGIYYQRTYTITEIVQTY